MARPPIHPIQPDGTKKCRMCCVSKKIDTEFPWVKPKGRAPYPNSLCRLCYNIWHKSIRAKRPEDYRRYVREYAEKNPEKVRQMNCDYHRKNGFASNKKYRATAKGKLNAFTQSQKRVAVKMGALTDKSHLVTGEWAIEQQKRQGFRCYYCFSMPMEFEMDHVIPISRGGKHVCENIVAACVRCNRSKHNKLLSEWPQPQLAIAMYGLDLASA